jgi:hypothetical protein
MTYLLKDSNRPKQDSKTRNTPSWVGEWALSNNFDEDASDDFQRKFADVQKLVYGKGAGWIV